ncbi:site-specific integrase [Psychroflexus sp. ALD_RP9]|uniref:site-specific integrase n=1 Tax=Psychroflexus sp. ALD_RP9 TaxID=2777186 RepID=UPI001A8CD0C8|nr:site-specific integrase [Psychroflexus sp. ALD_RP9]QSS96281.1 site-specific integrase [Psychroflexus sp. ALD_RP9]
MKPNLVILVWANKSKRNSRNQIPLYLRLTVSGKRAEISLNEKVDIKLWDAKFQKVKGSSNEARSINHTIDTAKAKINALCDEAQRAGEFITPTLIKNKFLGKDIKYETLSQLVDYHQTKMKNFLKPGTLKNYFTTKKYLDKFVETNLKTTDVFIRQVNYKFIIDFEDFLRKQNGLQNNGVMKHLERLKKLMNLAEDLEWIKKNPVKRYKLRFDEVDTGYLSQSDLNKVIQAEFESQTLNVVRDVFVFACYTGLAYSDLKKLSKEEITIGIDGQKWIHTRRQKTNAVVRIPLLDIPLQIIKDFENHPRVKDSDNLLPVFSNQKMNKYLKDIAKKLGIKQRLSSHIARHTFATTVTLANGVPIESVSKLLGHRKLSTTQIYARIIDTKLSEDLRGISQSSKLKNRNIS